MLCLKGNDMGQDCVSFLQDYFPAEYIKMLLVALHLLLLKLVTLPMNCVSFPQDYFPAAFIKILLVALHLLLLELVTLYMSPSECVALINYCTCLLEVGMATKFGTNPEVTSIGRQGSLQTIRKYKLKPRAEFLVQL